MDNALLNFINDYHSIFTIIFSYLLGSVNFAILIAKLLNLPDPTTHGSNNPGATNFTRVAGKKYGALVLILDVFKGMVPLILFGSNIILLFAVVLGHIYPVFHRFNGGKGFATFLGAALIFNPYIFISVCMVWVAIFILTKTSSLSTLTSALAAPVAAFALSLGWNIILSMALVVILLYWTHRSNIVKLLKGEELVFKD